MLFEKYCSDNDLFVKVISVIILLNKFNVNRMILNNYILQFYNKYKGIISLYDKKQLFKEYILFCNENQFVKYVNAVIKNAVIDYHRRESARKKYIYLNDQDDILSSNFDNLIIVKKDMDFIKLFYDGKQIIIDKKDGNILDVSQQAVTKRKNRIQKKYNIKF